MPSGAGELPDAAEYGDEGSDTLGNVATRGRRPRPAEPRGARPRQHRGAPGLPAAAGRAGDRGQARRAVEGQGHDDRPLGADGRPDADAVPDVSARLPARRHRPVHAPHRAAACSATRPASGTEIIQELGEEHQQTGKWIVYTSADSVFQIAAHEETVPLEELYEACRIAREILTGKHAVGRVIARPFVGEPGNYERTPNRHDFSLEPKRPNYLSLVREAGHAGARRRQDQRHLRRLRHRRVASDEVERRRASRRPSGCCASSTTGFVFVNLVETDMLWGHRNDPGELPPLPAGLRPPAARPARRAAPRRPLHPHVRPRLRPDDAVDRSLARARAAARVRRRPLRERRAPRRRVRRRRRDGQRVARRQGAAARRFPDSRSSRRDDPSRRADRAQARRRRARRRRAARARPRLRARRRARLPDGRVLHGRLLPRLDRRRDARDDGGVHRERRDRRHGAARSGGASSTSIRPAASATRRRSPSGRSSPRAACRSGR